MSIHRHGLLAPDDLLPLFAVGDQTRATLPARRPASVVLTHALHGSVTITDNRPLIMSSLAACLDDGLTPADWLKILNQRVFLWANRADADRLLDARLHRAHDRVILVFDTLSLARRHAGRMELSAINSGSTIRRPARRGLRTFTPLARHTYADWRRLRDRNDTIREVTILGGINDPADHLAEIIPVSRASY